MYAAEFAKHVLVAHVWNMYASRHARIMCIVHAHHLNSVLSDCWLLWMFIE